jgi:hypothetical protein
MESIGQLLENAAREHGSRVASPVKRDERSPCVRRGRVAPLRFPPGMDHGQAAQQLEREIRRLSGVSGH